LRFFHKVRSALWTFRGKKIGVLGLAFKGGTDDIRESPALDIVHRLLREGCIISAYDPAAEQRSKEVIPPSGQMLYVSDPYAAAQDADALLILNDWKDFMEIDFKRLHHTLRYPIVIDGRNMFDPATMAGMGFTYLSVGRANSSQPLDPIPTYFLPRQRVHAKPS